MQAMPRREERILGLDSLRGAAALSVALFHYGFYYDVRLPGSAYPTSAFAWGYYGVNLFFMISGYVIVMSLASTRRPADFLVSRASRLFPAYWAALLATVAVLRTVGPDSLAVGAADAAWNLTMIQGLLGVPHVDESYWTLQVELSFYGLMLLAYLLGGFRKLPFLLAVMLALSLADAVFGSRVLAAVPGYADIRVLLILPHVPLFALGIAIWRLTTPVPGRGAAADILVVAAGLGLLKLRMPWDSFALHLLFTACLYAAGRQPSRFLAWRPLVTLGAVSYPFYLVHQIIGYAVIHALEARQWPREATIPAALAICLGLAAVLHVGVEKPALKGIRAWWARRRAKAGMGESAEAVARV